MADEAPFVPEVEDQRRVSMSNRNFEELIYISARLYTLTRNMQYRNINHMGDMVESLTIMLRNLDEVITETIRENGGQVEIVDIHHQRE